MKMGLTQDERRNYIVEQLKLSGKVRVSELSEQIGISEVTIRSDLAELEREGILERVHGGAIQTLRNYYALDYSERQEERKSEKLQIASLVSSMVSDGDSLVINSGSTCYYLACELKQKKNLKIITHSIQIAEVLSEVTGFEVILLGGVMNYQYLFTYGDDAAQQLNKYQVSKAILSADGVDPVSGITTYHHEVSDLCHRMMAKANTRIVVADNTKIGHTAFSHVIDMLEVDYLVTDELADKEKLKQFEKMGVDVISPIYRAAAKQRSALLQHEGVK